MHIPVLLEHPQMIGPVLRGTPVWVWGLLAGLVWLGASQLRDRSASLARVSVMPVAMIALSIWGMTSAFGSSPLFGYVMLMWMLAGAVVFAIVGTMRAPKGTQYDAAARTFFLPGSWVPMALIAGIFVTRYIVNVDVAIQPAVAREGSYTLAVAALYGMFSGIFLGRAARLWRMASERGSFNFMLQRDPS
jgi:hypothetical protein